MLLGARKPRPTCTSRPHSCNALASLTESIQAKDNAQARHIRALVYEMMGQNQDAMADKSVAYRLDETHQSAWLNEKPEEVLLDQYAERRSMESGDTEEGDVEPTEAAAEDEPDQYVIGRGTATTDETEDSTYSDSPASETPWTSSSPGRGVDADRQLAAESGPTTPSRRAAEPVTASQRRLPAVDLTSAEDSPAI